MTQDNRYEDKYNAILKILSNNTLSLHEKFDQLNLIELLQNTDIYQAELLAQNQELLQKENDLIEARAEFEEIYNLAPISYFELSIHWKILKFNKFAMKTFQQKNINSFKSKPFSLLINPSSAIAYSKMIQELETKDNVYAVLDFSKNENFFGRVDISKHNKNFLVSITDITNEVLLQQSLQKLNQELELEVIKRTNKLNDFMRVNTAFVWEIGRDGKYTFVSENVKHILGYEVDEIVGKMPFDFMDKVEAFKLFEQFEVISSEESQIENLFNWNIAKSGEKVCLLSNGIPFYNEDNEYLGYRGSSLNITNEMNKTEIIEQQKVEFEAIFNYSKDGIAILDLSSKFIDCNDAYLEMTGYTKEELLTKSCIELTASEDKEKSKKVMEEVMVNGFVENFEKSCEVNYGKIIIINMTLSLMPDKKRIIAVTKNITQTKIIETQVKLCHMGELIENISHQWRQPLSVISSIASGVALKKEYKILDEEEIIADMNKIVHETQNLSKTIDAFRNFLHGNEPKQNFFIKSLISRTLSILEVTLIDQNIHIVQECDLDFEVNGYENELIQALINIINNAKDVLVEKVDINSRYIFISANKIDDRCEIRVRDNGGGIDPAILSRIFDPYFTTKHQSQGKGLGLSTTHKIITQIHGGTVVASNVTYLFDGKQFTGACFTIVLDISK